MKFIANLVFLATIAFVASANINYENIVFLDYLDLTQSTLQRDIDKMQRPIEFVDQRGENIINHLDLNAETLLQKVQKFDDTLVSLQVLSQIRNYCIQKYRVEVLSYSVVEEEMTACRNAAQTRVTNLMTVAKSSVATANVDTNSNLPASVDACINDNPNNWTEREACVIEKVELYKTQSQNYLNAAEKNLLDSDCTLNDLMRDALICTSKTEQHILKAMARILVAIDYCVGQVEEKCPCISPSTTTPLPALAELLAEKK